MIEHRLVRIALLLLLLLLMPVNGMNALVRASVSQHAAILLEHSEAAISGSRSHCAADAGSHHPATSSSCDHCSAWVAPAIDQAFNPPLALARYDAWLAQPPQAHPSSSPWKPPRTTVINT